MKWTIYSSPVYRDSPTAYTIVSPFVVFFPPLRAISTSKLVINCRTSNIIVI